MEKSLPPIKQLFSDSWNIFTHSILNLLVFSLIGIAAYIVLFVVGFILVLTFGVGTSVFQGGGLSSYSGIALILMSFLALVWIIALVIVGFVFQIGLILIVGNYPQKLTIGEIIRKSLGLILPFIVVSLLVFIIVVGGLFVLIIPYLVFAFLLMFAIYEVILNNTKGVEALRRSVMIVVRHFGPLLIRILILIGIYIGFAIISSLISGINKSVGVLVSIIWFVVNILLSWFILAFMVTLYKQAKEGLDTDTTSHMKWLWIVSIIGWVLIIIGLVGWLSLGVFRNLQQPKLNTLPTREQQLPLPGNLESEI